MGLLSRVCEWVVEVRRQTPRAQAGSAPGQGALVAFHGSEEEPQPERRDQPVGVGDLGEELLQRRRVERRAEDADVGAGPARARPVKRRHAVIVHDPCAAEPA